MTNSGVTSNYGNDEVSLLDLWLILREQWVFLASATVAGMVIAIVAGLLMTPVYRAVAVIAEVENGGATRSAASSLLGQFGGLAGLAGVNLRGLGDNRNDGRTIIQSRTFIEQFIAEQNLMPLLYTDYWDEETHNWEKSVKRPPVLWQGANKFIKEVFSIDEAVETGLLTISVEWPDPELAANWTNRLVALANEIARQQDISEAEKSIAYLNEQIEQTNAVELQRVLYNLVEAEQKILMLASAREDYVFQVVDPAMVPVAIAKPNRILLIFLGTILGGFLGLILVFVRRFAKGLKEQEAAR